MYHIASSTCTMLLSRLQTRCKHLIWSHLNVQARLSFCIYFLLYPLVTTLQDWSVNYVRKLKCQPCMEAAQPVPADHYWGAQTQRSLIHFSIGDDHMPKEVYHACGYVKKADSPSERKYPGTCHDGKQIRLQELRMR